MRDPGDNDDDDNDGLPSNVGYNESRGGDHHTLYDRTSDNHISWDTDSDGNYVNGTGHEDADGGKVNDWDND